MFVVKSKEMENHILYMASEATCNELADEYNTIYQTDAYYVEPYDEERSWFK
jgi:hypothetical protein